MRGWGALSGRVGWSAVLSGVVGLAGCAAHRDAAPREGTGGSGFVQQPSANPQPGGVNRKYVDPELGFEVARPDGDWQLDASGESTPEGIAIPVVLRHRDSGAQVVIQVAPAIATPTQFAERLVSGLRNYEGFTATDPEPLPLSEDAVGFRFAMEKKVLGRIAVRAGSSGKVLMMVATWPADASDGVTSDVDQIFVSVRPVPAS
jgi:hypothetical protein